MKKCLALCALIALSNLLFAIPNYKNGNGTITFSSEKDEVKTTIRKCEIADILIGDLLEEENRTIYKKYDFKKSSGKLKDNDKINVLEVCTKEYIGKKDKWNNQGGELWYKIRLNKKVGWICKNRESLGEITNPYYDDRYEILEELQGARRWTVRKLNQYTSVWNKLNVYEEPGLESKIISTIHDFEEGSRSHQENYDIIAITEETETIDEISDHWLKIKYAENSYGWIFGGYTTQERGGPRYYIPENMVRFDLGWY